MKVNDQICPLCQQPNRCDVAAPTGCWCMKTNVPEALIARVPQAMKNKRCICNACITQYLTEQNKLPS